MHERDAALVGHPSLKPDRAQHFQGTEMKMAGARVDGSAVIALDRQRLDAVPREERRCRKPNQTAADNEDISLDHAILPGAVVFSSAIKAAIEGLVADLVFDLETERSTRNHGKRVTAPHGDA
jgi:hypothetical protein